MTAERPGGFLVLHGNRLEDLRSLVVGLVRNDPLPPLVPEVFLVQSNGMKHWLEQSLADDSEGLGICAATQLVLPSSFLWEAYRAVLGAGAVPHELPFDKDALAWRLLRLLPVLAAGDERFLPLQRYLAADTDGRHAWQLAQQVADVLDGYQQYRADWLEDWAGGGSAGAGTDHAWQPALWRALLVDVGPDRAASSRAAVHGRFVQALAACSNAGQRPPRLPPRVIVFGITALPLQSVEALAELGRVCQVVLAVQNPCRHYWAHIVGTTAQLQRLQRYRQSAKDGRLPHELPVDPVALHGETHALLAAWGKQGRDYLHLLDRYDQTQSQPHRLGRTDVFTEPLPPGAPATRLRRLQDSILDLEPAPATPADVPLDDSIRFVTCHSAQREVEVLHDQLLAWLDADPTLEPGDILVMVPDMATFAAHVQAVFGRYAPGEDRHLPYSLADVSVRQSPLVQALERWLLLPEGRITLPDWQALFEVPAVRRRYGLSEDDVAGLRDWLEAAGVRWGLDATHRKAQGLPPGLPGLEQNSWAEGLRRLLLGYASGTDQPWAEVLPVAGIGGLEARRLGALDAWLADVGQFTAALRQPHTPDEWLALLQSLLARVFDDSDSADAQLLQRLREALQAWHALCAAAALEQPLPLCVIREHWLERVEPPALRQRFFGGGVQFATLMPMRSIPFRCVCLLGMNDGDYPRPAPQRDFDLLADDWRPGDRSRREDDRYLFLEALLSARERLYLSWVGRRATDNAGQPPSVVVAQLRDELRRRWQVESPALEQPLQPFSARYYDAHDSVATYDRDWQPCRVDQLPDRLAGIPEQRHDCPLELRLADLQRLLHRPVEVYWRRRLGVRLDAPAEALPEDEPFDYDSLEDHRVTADLLEALQRHSDDSAALQRLRLAGVLPLGAVGALEERRLHEKARAVLDRATPLLQTHSLRAEALPLSLQFGAAVLQDAIPGLHVGAEGLLQLVLHAGAVRHLAGGESMPRHHLLLRPWALQVCLAAAGHASRTVVCGADDQLLLPPVPQATALRILGDWLPAWECAWRAPLPVAARTAFALLQAEDINDDSVRSAFEGTPRFSGDLARCAYLQRSVTGFDEASEALEQWTRPLYGALWDHLAAAEAVAGAPS